MPSGRGNKNNSGSAMGVIKNHAFSSYRRGKNDSCSIDIVIS